VPLALVLFLQRAAIEQRLSHDPAAVGGDEELLDQQLCIAVSEVGCRHGLTRVDAREQRRHLVALRAQLLRAVAPLAVLHPATVLGAGVLGGGNTLPSLQYHFIPENGPRALSFISTIHWRYWSADGVCAPTGCAHATHATTPSTSRRRLNRFTFMWSPRFTFRPLPAAPVSCRLQNVTQDRPPWLLLFCAAPSTQ